MVRTLRSVLGLVALGFGALGSLAIYGEVVRQLGYEDGYKNGQIDAMLKELVRQANKYSTEEEESADSLAA